MTVYKSPADRQLAKAQEVDIGKRLAAELSRTGVDINGFEYLAPEFGDHKLNWMIDRHPRLAGRLDALFMHRLALAGVDVGYVITGRRHAPAAQEPSDAESEAIREVQRDNVELVAAEIRQLIRSRRIPVQTVLDSIRQQAGAGQPGAGPQSAGPSPAGADPAAAPCGPGQEAPADR